MKHIRTLNILALTLIALAASHAFALETGKSRHQEKSIKTTKNIVVSTSFPFYRDRFRMGSTDAIFAKDFPSIKQSNLSRKIFESFKGKLLSEVSDQLNLLDYNSQSLPSAALTSPDTLHIQFNIGMRSVKTENSKALLGSLSAVINPRQAGNDKKTLYALIYPEPFLISKSTSDITHLSEAIDLAVNRVATTVNNHLINEKKEGE